MNARGLFGLLIVSTVIAAGACTNAPAPRVEALPTLTVVDSLHPTRDYAAEVRAGLGSPFRVIESMLRDPRVDEREQFGAALLRQVREGQMYHISPVVLLVPGVSQTSAIAQLELIRDAILRARDPRVGEAAVNRTYANVDSLPAGLSQRAARAAALYRDYALAFHDAVRLHLAARQEHVRETNLLIHWREQRRFAVEQPTLAPLDSSARTEAQSYALLLQGGLRAALLPATGPLARRIAPEEIDSAQTQLALFDSAVALRPYAQENVAPDSTTARDLSRDFGVTVRFASQVTTEQRARTLRDLKSALTDMRAVLPTATFSGLRFDVRPIHADARYQAYHDPRNRVIRIDPTAHAGTIAHELGHDLDWQLARRKYAVSGRYATDYAMKRDRGLTYLVANLGTEGDRPTEAFARRFEWYVAAALAERGIMNGVLSSVQNDWINGHGWAIKPDATPIATSSFASILAQAARMNNGQKRNALQLLNAESSIFPMDTVTFAPLLAR